MSAKIAYCDDGSIADQLGLKCGDELVAINGNGIFDVIDYMYYSDCEKLEITAVCDGENVEFDIEKDADEPLGINFDTYLIDKQRSCKNKCIFCFIDQLPKGLRDTLYFKDDDARLSFLMGNYITLTNLDEYDIDRICRMRISPINVSVHTTDPELRVKMMKNPNARNINIIMERFAKAGVTMNCQIVLCKGVNDGENLERSLRDLEKLYPAVNSCSIVPVGLSDHREGLCHLEPFDADDCRKVIDQIESFSAECLKKHGVRLFYPSDEFFIKGNVPLPDEDYYDGYPQIENGVGISTSLLTEVDSAVSNLDFSETPAECAIITGVLPVPVLETAIAKIKTKRPKLNCTVFPVKNRFFGENITVAGLVTASDMIEQIKGKPLPERVLIPSSMLRAEQDMFLDSVTVEKVEDELSRKLTVTYNDGFDLVSKILDERTECDE